MMLPDLRKNRAAAAGLEQTAGSMQRNVF